MAEILRDFVQRNAPKNFSKEAVVVNELGDFLTVYFSDEDAYTRRIDDLVTVYYSESSNEVVGVKIKGVRRRINEIGSLGISLESGDISVWVLIANSLDFADIEPEMFKYYRLIQEKTLPVRIEPSRLAIT